MNIQVLPQGRAFSFVAEKIFTDGRKRDMMDAIGIL